MTDWFKKLGGIVKKMREYVVGMDVSENDMFVCEMCEVNKAKRRPVPNDCSTRAKETLDYVHYDVLGPVSPVSVDGHKYAIGFQDSYSRNSEVCFMKSSDEVAGKCEQYCADTGEPKVIVTDCAKEFVSVDVKTFCRNKRIRQEISATYTPEENGKIERVLGTFCV